MGHDETARDHKNITRIQVRHQPRPVVRKHLNKVSLQGVVVSAPKFRSLSSGTRSCVFKIKSIETYTARGVTQAHENEFVIEALGSSAEKVARFVKKGGEYIFDGYLRSDSFVSQGRKLKRIRVRIFHVEKY